MVCVSMVAQVHEMNYWGLAREMVAKCRREFISQRKDAAALDESRLADAPWSSNNAYLGCEHAARCS
jgi:hypothetical protein